MGNKAELLSDSIDRLRNIRDLYVISSEAYTALDYEIDQLVYILNLL